jgi:hypothetical protein
MRASTIVLMAAPPYGHLFSGHISIGISIPPGIPAEFAKIFTYTSYSESLSRRCFGHYKRVDKILTSVLILVQDLSHQTVSALHSTHHSFLLHPAGINGHA